MFANPRIKPYLILGGGIFVIALLLSRCFPIGSASAMGAPEFEPAYPVEVLTFDWEDESRKRQIPVKIYIPKAQTAFPVILYSHGLGGSRDTGEYLGRNWAGNGYVSVHLQHKGSDVDVWKGSGQPLRELRHAVKDPMNFVNRPKDISFAIDKLTELNSADSELKGRLDLSRIGVSGHSMGSLTALAIAGQVFLGKTGELTFRDDRVKAAVPMSSPIQREFVDKAYDKIKIPCMHLTGTRDESVVAKSTPKEPRIPFDKINAGDQYLITFVDGDHMIFGGWRFKGTDDQKDPVFHRLIALDSTAFWDAYLKDDSSAKRWLRGDGLERSLNGNAKLERKLNRIEEHQERK